MAGKNRCSNSPNGQLAVKRPKMHFFEKNLFRWTTTFIFVGSKQKNWKKKSWGAHCLAQSLIFAPTALERPRFNFFWFFCFRPLYCNLEYRFCTKKAKKSQKKFAFWKKSQQGPIWEIQAKFGKVTLEALFQTGPQGPNNIFSCTHIDKTPWGLKWPSPKNCVANVLYWRVPVS